jgi:hypothetical protein
MDQARYTPIQVYIKGEAQNPGYWNLGVWDYTTNRPAWGLCTDEFPTHMCYSLLESPPKPVVENRMSLFKEEPEEDENGYSWNYWFFDVGRRLYVTLPDLKAACVELGIWDGTSEAVQSKS